MVAQSDRLTDLLLGKQWSMTRRALALACGFGTATLMVEYLLFRTRFDNEVIGTLYEVFLLDEYLPSLYATGTSSLSVSPPSTPISTEGISRASSSDGVPSMEISSGRTGLPAESRTIISTL